MQKFKLEFISFLTIFNFLLVFLTFAFLLSTIKVSALDMNSDRFRIQGSNVNSASGNKSSDNYKLQDTVGQTAAGQFASAGYIVKAGFQYIHSIIPFTFKISNINISLGTLIPDTPVTATTNLTVSFGGAGQYQVTAIENHPLNTLSGNAIPDTACNGGADTCTKTAAKLWDSTTAYGFGYNMSGQDIPADFTTASYYRPFPNLAVAESPQVVMASTNVTRSSQSTLTFKANVSSLIPAGSYQTIINFVAMPSF